MQKILLVIPVQVIPIMKLKDHVNQKNNIKKNAQNFKRKRKIINENF